MNDGHSSTLLTEKASSSPRGIQETTLSTTTILVKAALYALLCQR